MTSPRIILTVITAGVALVVAYMLGSRSATTPAEEPASRSAPKRPRTAQAPTPPPTATTTAPEVATAGTISNNGSVAGNILARIATLKSSASKPQALRQLLFELEKLKKLGAAALPELNGFLAGGSDEDYDSAFGRIGFKDGTVPQDFTIPPSLRLALLEVVKNIGGPEAEQLLARELKATGRGVEAAYIAGALEQLAPGKYADAAAAAARELLAMPLTSASKNPLDRSDREYLYNILAASGDRSQVASAQSQLLLPTGQIDRGALRYLQQTLGENAVAIASRAWEDPRVPANQKEPLARVALAYVGSSDRAEQLYRTAIDDAHLTPDARRNLIEDLNQDGFANPKQLTPGDLALIQKRLALIDQLAPRAKDPVNIAAFAEARKDLVAMRDKALQPPTPPKK